MSLVPSSEATHHPIRQPGVLRFSSAQFLVSLVLFFVIAPFLELFHDGDLVESVLLSLVLSTAVLAVGARPRTLAWGIVMVTPALVGKWVNHWWPDRVPAGIILTPALLFIIFVVFHLLRFILRAPRIDSEVLCAGVAGYLMLGLLWALAYVVVARTLPGSFAFTVSTHSVQSMKGFTALYFSLITLTTVGYGDIVPMVDPARMLAMMEAMTGTLYMAILVARLVSLYSAPGSPAGASEPGKS